MPPAGIGAAGGARLANPNAGAAKLGAPLASPSKYFDLSFDAPAGIPYHLWIRGKAASNSWANDSVFVQFSDSVTASGAATVSQCGGRGGAIGHCVSVRPGEARWTLERRYTAASARARHSVRSASGARSRRTASTPAPTMPAATIQPTE